MQFVIIAVEKCCLSDFFQTAFNKTKTLYPSVKLKQKKQHCCWCLTTRNFFSYTALFFTPVVFFLFFLKEVWASEMQNILFLEFSSTISLTFKMALFFKGLFSVCVCAFFFLFFLPFPCQAAATGAAVVAALSCPSHLVCAFAWWTLWPVIYNWQHLYSADRITNTLILSVNPLLLLLLHLLRNLVSSSTSNTFFFPSICVRLCRIGCTSPAK